MTPHHFIPENEVITTKALLNFLSQLHIPEPLRELHGAFTAYLEHGLRPGTESPADFDKWMVERSHLLERLKAVSHALSREVYKQHLIPLFPGLAEQIAVLDPKIIGGELCRRASTYIREQIANGETAVPARIYGAETLGLLRALVGGAISKGHREKVVDLITKANSAIQKLTRYDANQEALGDDTGTNDYQTLKNATVLLGTLYENRGKVVVRLLWGLAHLNGWCGGQAPGDAHDTLAKTVLAKNLPTHTLGDFDFNWRHWRNSVDHNLYKVEFDGEWHVKIVDKDTKGKITYSNTFSGAQVLFNLGKAWELLHIKGAYPDAIELLYNETLRDSMSEQVIASYIERIITLIK